VELNWTTFVLEIVNFLVLVWLLKRFFYKPVKAMIAKRQQGIEEKLQQAKEMQQQAEELRAQYENRLDDWEGERQEARKQLQQEIDAERSRMLSELQLSLEAERKKSEILAARQAEEQQRQSETRALELGARFTSRLLNGVASAELQARLLELLMAELQQLGPAQRDALLHASESSQSLSAQVMSAYPLNHTQQSALEQYLDALLPGQINYDYSQDSELIAGVRITVGSWVIHANLHDELKSFANMPHEH
jgi:F-type H+-transporting ATPase subunit b